MDELKAPQCPQCRRPLQRGREKCVYCGYVLNEAEREEVASVLTEELVEKHIKQAQSMLDATLPDEPIKPRGIWFKILVVVLSLVLMGVFAWISDWNVIVIVLVVLFFSIPIWHVFRR